MSAENNLSKQLGSLGTNVFSPDELDPYKKKLRDDLQMRCKAANQRDAAAWTKVKSRDDWEKFCAPRIEALKRSLGLFPSVPSNPNVHVTRTIEGDGYSIENIVYESRKGIYVTANLYIPSSLQQNMPAIIIVHSHHNPKTQGELQDMGMTWARAGCAVLVMDQLSYGERGQHQPGPRQDYRFRYINGIQLHLIGDSLMGWMVWDIMRGVDLLLSRKDIDRERLILMGAVAGGGDPAAVAAAIDSRIKCVIPFNFGGPQPETQYPLPEDAEKTFNYMGYGYWESTRNLHLSGRDGFLPWVIVASIAPRHLIYAHEFSWDKDRDPVWKRLQKVFEFYDASGNLDFAHGLGVLTGSPPEATHCNNVGAFHRGMIYPALERWFGIPVPEEYQNRMPPEDLSCLTPDLKAKIHPLHRIIAEIGDNRASEAQISPLPDGLRHKWRNLLGDIDPKSEPVAELRNREIRSDFISEQIVLTMEKDIAIPVLGLMPSSRKGKEIPAVLAIAQEGKEGFLRENSDELAELLKHNIAIFLPDLRDTGEINRSVSRERQSEATSIAATELMLGQTLLGSQLRDVRSVLRYLCTRDGIDGKRIALWGDSFASANPSDLSIPLIDEGEMPRQSEPLGGLLALFAALYEDYVCAVAVRGMIAGYRSVLSNRLCYIPYDTVVPGAITAGDLCHIVAALAPRPLRLEVLVDGLNRLVSHHELESYFGTSLLEYSAAYDRLSLQSERDSNFAEWLAIQISS